MKHYCHYHPLSPAIWHCETCQIYFDKLCMPDGDDKLQQAECPHCKSSLRYLDRKAATSPFWEHKTQFVKQIAQAESLLTLSILALLSIALSFSWVIALICTALITVLSVNAATVHARHTEQSKDEPLTLSALFSFSNAKTTLILSGILVFTAVAPIAANYFIGLTFASFLCLALFLLAPACMLMCLYQTPAYSRRQFSRPNAYQIAKKMGPSYLTLCFYCLLSYLVTLTLSDVLLSSLPSMLAYPLAATVGIACIWFNFSVMGYIHRRYEGFNDVSETRRIQTQKDKYGLKSERFEADLDIAVKSGHYEQALSLLEIALKKQGRSDLRRQQLYKLLIERNDLPKLEQYAESILELLIGRGQYLPAYELIAKIKQSNSDFLIYDVSLIKRLSDIFHEMKEDELVIWLAESCQRRFESSHELSQIYLRAAKTLLSRLKRPKEAMMYLEKILQEKSDEETTFAAQRLKEHIASLRALGR